MPTTHTVAVYCRISKDPTRLEVGVERQRGDCLALTHQLWPQAQVRTFVDNDLSAADPAVARPQWQALLDALRCGDIDQIVTYDQSRLTRQPLEWEQLLVILERRNIASVHTVREGERDVAEGGGRMVSRIMAAVDAEYAEYAEVTRVRIRRAMRQLASEGRPNGGRVFGYVSAVGEDGRKTRAVVPHEAAAVRWAASELLRGETLASVARAFEAQRLAHVRKGKFWYPTTIRNLVTNPTVAGLRPDPDGNLIAAIWPPILDAATWHGVRATLAQPVTLTRSDGALYRTTRQRRPSRRHLLSAGLAFCGVCGAPLSAQVRKRASGAVFVVYLCNPRVGRVCVAIVGHRLERHVVESLLAAFADPSTRQLLAGVEPTVVAGLSAKLEAVDVQLAELARRWGRGEISRAEWDGAREGLASRSQDLRNRLGVLALPAFNADEVADRWDEMGLAGRRAILARVFERIEVRRATTRDYDPERIKLTWRNPAVAAAVTAPPGAPDAHRD
jgi:site-specific DNA recombinase